MAVKTGVGAQLGAGKETTWGSPVTVDGFLPFTSESLKLVENYIRTAGLRAGQLAQSGALHVQTTRMVAGDVVFDMLTKGMGRWLHLLNGDTNAPTTPGGATLARKFSFAVGRTDPGGKGLTVQVGRPDVGGTVRSFTYPGCKATQVVFKFDKGGTLNGTWTLDGKDEDTATATATATYPSGAVPFNFTSGAANIDDVLLPDIVSSGSITIAIPQAVDRFGLGSGGTKAEPLQNGLVAITAQLDLEFTSLAQQTAFRNATRRKLQLVFTGPNIESGFNHSLTFTMPQTVTVDNSPNVGGPDILNQTPSFEATDDGTNPPLTIDWITTDTAL
jgi:Phage tail tube protein